MKLERQTDPHRLNRLANHPAIAPTFRGHAVGRLDFSGVVANPENIVLLGQHGGMIFHPHQYGFYECHTAVTPEGRGAWALEMVRACLAWVFSRTEAVEICTKVPKGNLAARALVRAIGGVYEFTNRHGWILNGDPVPADIFSMHVHQWIREAPGLVERGQWFHKRLEEEYARFGRTEKPHPDDASHDRQVGAACEMMFGGQPAKGMIFYNRWAALAGYEPVKIIGMDPLTIDIRDAILVARDNDFRVVSCLAECSLAQPLPESAPQ